ncbi:uncharacterized protein LOC113563276 [Ooceraea biroi]|uniref:uncharacterized protein LOC113563276 n=1 Tax=Ooceraea biroi TaxID=2015173 RepID=UPI000F091407|nr:uncharacterized protein LOC113563276 [Ooceraea biroi]
MNARKCENEESKSAGNDNIPNQVESQLETGSVYSNEAGNLQNFYDTKNQNMNQNAEYENKRKASESPLFENITMKKNKDRFLQCEDAAQQIIDSKRKKNLSISSEYDVFKWDLEAMENFQKFGDIELAHDLDTVEIDDSIMKTSINKDPLTIPFLSVIVNKRILI